MQAYFSNYSTNAIESSNNIGPSILKAIELPISID